MLELAFWALLLLVVYSYVIYPVILLIYSGSIQIFRDINFVLNRARPRIKDIGSGNGSELPRVAVIISAYNEAQCIGDRVRNLQNLNYPKDKICYYIGSDGSDDNTAAILKEINDPNLIVTDFEVNRGKASVLNDLVAMAEADYLVFSDANTQFETNAIVKLVRHFTSQNPADVVCGELNLVDEISGLNQDSTYWKYERILKFNESRVGGLLGANGAIYAIRKSRYTPLAADTIVDDFTIAFEVAVNGGRVIYDPEAIAVEAVAPTASDEYSRRVRIGAGNYQAFHRFYKALSPQRGALCFTYFSHKVLRWFSPHALFLALLVSCVLSFGSFFYGVLFVLQCLIYMYSFVCTGNIRFKLIALLVFWVKMNMALGQGSLRYYFGNAKGTWKSTNR